MTRHASCRPAVSKKSPHQIPICDWDAGSWPDPDTFSGCSGVALRAQIANKTAGYPTLILFCFPPITLACENWHFLFIKTSSPLAKASPIECYPNMIGPTDISFFNTQNSEYFPLSQHIQNLVNCIEKYSPPNEDGQVTRPTKMGK
jgi:hypothetical protein